MAGDLIQQPTDPIKGVFFYALLLTAGCYSSYITGVRSTINQ